MKHVRALVAWGCLLSTASIGHADIVAWHDAEGVTHYVDRWDAVPEERRAEARTIARTWERAEPPLEATEDDDATDDENDDARARDEDSALVATLRAELDQARLEAEEVAFHREREPPVEVVVETRVEVVQVVEPVVTLAPPPERPAFLVTRAFVPGPTRPEPRRDPRPSPRSPLDPPVGPAIDWGPAGPPPFGAARPVPSLPRAR